MSGYNKHTLLLTVILNVFPLVSFYWFYQQPLTVIVITLIMSFFIGVHTSIFAHRAWAHKSWIPSPLLNLWGLIIFTLTPVGHTIAWVAVHREHHRFSDTSKDPHSPFYKSRWRLQFLPYFNNVNIGYATDMVRDKRHLWFAKYYWHIHALWYIMLVIVNADLLMMWISAMSVTLVGTHMINVFAHNTPYWLLPNSNNPSIGNPLLLGLFMHNGEAWHKNHHDDPMNWSFQRRWYEIDIGAYLIKMFVLLRIAHIPNADKKQF